MTQMSQRSPSEIRVIERHNESLRRAPWLGNARAWWPHFLFHCTDVRNVASILTSGELLSRVQATKDDKLATDIAAPNIIERTSVQLQDYVRLYFRPRTPTQYRNEGFRPQGLLYSGAHCPVPVYILFRAIEVLSRADSQFTDGNVAAMSPLMNDVRQLNSIPFEDVYHDYMLPYSGVTEEARREIIRRRNAEVLIPQRLGLESVQMVLCRSQAEYETLLYLLPNDVNDQWSSRIGVDTRMNLFHSSWTFVEQVVMGSQRLLFRFNPDTMTPGPFRASVELEVPADPQSDFLYLEILDLDRLAGHSQTYSWTDNEFYACDVLRFTLARLGNPSEYSVRLELDGQLAYAGKYESTDLPF